MTIEDLTIFLRYKITGYTYYQLSDKNSDEQ